jgi:hypothetical protein
MDQQEKTEREFQRSATADPIYTPRTHGLTQDWECQGCGAQVSCDSFLLGSGRSSYALYCQRCGKPMAHHGAPRKRAIGEMIDRYGLNNEE